MLKKSASFVLAALRGATLSRNFSEVENAVGAFPFAWILARANGPHEVRYVPPRLFARCGLVWDKARLGAPGWAGEKSGLFEHPAGYSSVAITYRTLGFLYATTVFPATY